MNLRKSIATAFVGAAGLWALTGQAADRFKANNTTALDQSASWTNGAPASSDTAVWDNGVAMANTTNSLNAARTWGGIKILDPGAPVKVGTTAGSTLSVGSLGINLADANCTQDLWLALPVTASQAQTWSIKPGRTLTVGDAGYNVTIGANASLDGHVVFPNTILVNNGGSLTISSGSLLESTITNNATTSLSVGVSGGAGNVNQTGGAVIVGRPDGTSGSPKAGLILGSSGVGTYSITGGSFTDASPSSGGRVDVGTGGGVLGILNLSGNASVQLQSLYIANGGNGIVNVTNGTLTAANTAIRVGTGTGGYGTVNVYGGTVSAPAGINVQHSTSVGADAGFLNLYGGDVLVGGSLNVPNGIAAGTVTINGGTLVVTNNVNLPNNAAGTGTLNLNGGTLVALSLAHPASGSGTVVFNGGMLKAESDQASFISPAIAVNVSTNGASVDTANFSIAIGAALLNGTGGGADGGLTKLGSGTLTLTGANTYQGPTTVSAGTLVINNASSVGASTNLVVAPGATLNISGVGTLAVQSAPGLGGTLVMQITKTGSGLANDKLVLASGTFNCGGVLTVSATGSALAPGDTFDLFDAQSFHGGFSTVNLPALPGDLRWDSSRLNLDGTLSIPGTNTVFGQPAFNSARLLNGANLALGGSNGAPNTPYYVLTSTNPGLPLASWTMIATNQFDTYGHFSFTNAMNPALPAQYFALSLFLPTLSRTDSTLLDALQNMRDEGFNTYLAAPGGLYINWIYTNVPPVSPTMANINYDGTPDPSPTDRHDRLTDIVYLADLVLYKQLHPLDSQFDADIARYTTVCQSTNGDNYLNKPDQRGWIYWVLQQIISGLPSFTGYDDAQADKYYGLYQSNLSKFNNQVTPLYIDWNTDDDAGLHGTYNVSLVTEDACVLIVNGKTRHLSNYVAAGEALLAFAQSNAYSTTLKLWADTMGYLFTTTNRSGATVSPPAQQVIYDNSLPLSEIGEMVEALCRAEAADPGKGYGALALATLNKLVPATNSFGMWDTANGGYFANLTLNGTGIQSPSLTASVNTSYKTAGRAATMTQSFLAANHYAGATYDANTILAVHTANLNAYYSAGHGWPYQQNPNYSLYLDHGTGYSVLQNWVTSEAMSHAVRALLTYALTGPQ
jgi:autotransporter-associated beta strand protein